jgi:hypothetical protein
LDQANSKAREGAAAIAFRVTMAAGLLLALTVNLPGHLSVDSVVALVEARTGVRQTWAPAVSSWLLKLFDAQLSGTGLYVTALAAVLFVALMSLPRLRGRGTWVAVVLGALAIATPQILIYQGIVWRDVLFANLTVAGFICLAHAARNWKGRPPALPLAGALICLTLAALARQNGLILVVAAAAVLAWTVRHKGLGKSVAWGLGALIATGLLALTVNEIAQPQVIPDKFRLRPASLILEHYDIIGAKAHDPSLRFTAIGKVNPTAQALLETRSPKVYSSVRIDTLDADPVVGRTLWHVPDAAMNAQWREVILQHPMAYLEHRADAFRWVFLTPDIDLCLPVQTGVVGPQDMLQDLDMVTGMDIQDRALAAYAQRFLHTPVYSHLTWALASLVVIRLLLRRRDPADWVFVALLAGTLLFTASFAVISLACDYRYLYLQDLAAMVGVLYVALDPPFRRRRT